MSEFENPTGFEPSLKQKLLEALQTSVTQTGSEVDNPPSATWGKQEEHIVEIASAEVASSYSKLSDDDSQDSLPEELLQSHLKLALELQEAQLAHDSLQAPAVPKNEFDDKLSKRGVVPDVQTEIFHPAGAPSSSKRDTFNQSNRITSGGSMADLSGYRDLSKAPISFGDEDSPMSSLAPDTGYERAPQQFSAAQHFVQEALPQEVDTEFSGNVKTLIRLVNELPEGVTKQTGAQIIRLTMEAMGISMEDVLSEAQSAQSEMLDAVRANIKKIEEYKTVIRKLETDIKYYQGKANELSEIIDLFILSNTTGNKMAMPEDLGH